MNPQETRSTTELSCKVWRTLLLAVPFISSTWSHLWSSPDFGFQYSVTCLVKTDFFGEEPSQPALPYLTHPLEMYWTNWRGFKDTYLSGTQCICSINLCLLCEQKLTSLSLLYKLGSWNTERQSNLTVRAQNITRFLVSSTGHTAGGYLSGQSPAHKHPSSKKPDLTSQARLEK